MNNNRKNNANVLLRAAAAFSVLIGIVIWFSFRAEHNKFTAGCVVAGSLIVYLGLAHFFVPKRPKRSSWPVATRSRATMSTIKLFLLPGRLIVIALLDFVTMLSGKGVNHEATKVDVEL